MTELVFTGGKKTLLMKVRERIDVYLCRKAADYLRYRVIGYTLSEGPMAYDPEHLIAGWIFGHGWHLMFFTTQKFQGVPPAKVIKHE